MLFIVPVVLMVLVTIGLTGIEHWLSGFGKTEAARQTLGRAGIALPYVAAAVIGIVFLFASAGAIRIKPAGWGVGAGGLTTILVGIVREAIRLSTFAEQIPAGKSLLSYLDPATLIGAAAAALSACFALRVALVGNAAFASAEPKRISAMSRDREPSSNVPSVSIRNGMPHRDPLFHPFSSDSGHG